MSSTSQADDEAAVLTAHRAYYTAVAALEPAQMAAVWSRRPQDVCIHPGWDTLRGWREIHASWLTIFANMPYIRIETTDDVVRVHGDVAWVTCTEHIYTVLDQQVAHSQVAATHIFERLDGRWCLIHHHGSPVAHDVTVSDDADEDDDPALDIN